MTEHFIIHTVFDLLAVLSGLAGGFLVYRWRFRDNLARTAARLGGGYFVALSLGSVLGSYAFGTLNLHLSGIHEIGRSIVGALFGATLVVELYKLCRGIRGSTGYIYVVPFCLCVSVGRIGCFLAGIEDNTAGAETTLPWGHDFGDHVLRHPVQLYESLSMFGFLLGFLAVLKNHRDAAARFGFYACVGFYGAQRFLWEFLKPYAGIAGPLNIFHFVCLILVIYSLLMINGARHAPRTA